MLDIDRGSRRLMRVSLREHMKGIAAAGAIQTPLGLILSARLVQNLYEQPQMPIRLPSRQTST